MKTLGLADRLNEAAKDVANDFVSDSGNDPIIEANAMKTMAGVATLGDLASAIGIRTEVRTEEAAIIAELQAGSE